MPRKLGILMRDELLEHEFGPAHPLRSRDRIMLYLKLLEEKQVLSSGRVQIIRPSLLATEQDLLAVHDPGLIQLIKQLSIAGGELDPDTPVPPGTYQRTLIQAGALMEGSQRMLEGEIDCCIQCVAFGGHHATRSHIGKSFGFCYFNQEAVLIRYLQRKHLIETAFILDCDAHHGNGIQQIFYADPSVFYMSLHQDPNTLYPGTGFSHELGEGPGKGYNLNLPLPPGTSDRSYLRALKEFFPPLVEWFEPDLMLLILGADTYRNDPLTQLGLSLNAYPEIVKLVGAEADKLCDGRWLMELAGGYDLSGTANAFYLATAAAAELEYAVDEPIPQEDPWVSSQVDKLISELKSRLAI